MRSKRLTEPSLAIADLPTLDFVVLSHNHGDHSDEVAASELDKRVPIGTTPHAARKLRRQGFVNPARPGDLVVARLHPWRPVGAGDGHAGPARPPAAQRPPAPVMGSVLDFQTAGQGPSASTSPATPCSSTIAARSPALPRRRPGLRAPRRHTGARRPVTMDASQGVGALQIVRPPTAVPFHYYDYTVFKDPLSTFKQAVAAAALRTKVDYVAHGDTYRFEPARAAPER